MAWTDISLLLSTWTLWESGGKTNPTQFLGVSFKWAWTPWGAVLRHTKWQDCLWVEMTARSDMWSFACVHCWLWCLISVSHSCPLLAQWWVICPLVDDVNMYPTMTHWFASAKTWLEICPREITTNSCHKLSQLSENKKILLKTDNYSDGDTWKHFSNVFPPSYG